MIFYVTNITDFFTIFASWTRRKKSLGNSRLKPPQLSPETHEKLTNILVRFELAKGDLFLREGEICKYYSMVAQGMIRLFYDKNGRDLTEHFSYEKGIFVSLESYFRQTPSYLMIEALEPTVIYSFPHDQLQRPYANESRGGTHVLQNAGKLPDRITAKSRCLSFRDRPGTLPPTRHGTPGSSQTGSPHPHCLPAWHDPRNVKPSESWFALTISPPG